MHVQCCIRLRDLWPLPCRVKSNISNVCSAPSLRHPLKICLPARLIRSNSSLTGLQSTLRGTRANLALNRCFLKLGTAPAYTVGRYRALSSPELLVSYTPQFTLSIMSHNCLQCIGPFLCHTLLTKKSVSFLTCDWRTPALTTMINPGHLPLRARTHTHTHTHTHHTGLSQITGHQLYHSTYAPAVLPSL